MTGHDEATLIRLTEALLDQDHPIKVETATWAHDHLGQRDRIADDATSTFAVDDWRRCGERGIFGLLVPTELGGTGADLATTLLTLEGLGQGCTDNGLTFAAASQMLSTQIALVRFGTPAQQQRWLPGLLRGTTLAALIRLSAGLSAQMRTNVAPRTSTMKPTTTRNRRPPRKKR